MTTLERLIELAAKSTKFGQLNMTLGVHNGEIKYLEGSEHSSKNFSAAGNREAIEYLLQSLAKEQNISSTGALTVTFEFIKGAIKKVHTHRSFRHNLTEQKQ